MKRSGIRDTPKAGFTRSVRGRGVPLRRNQRGEYDVWQRRLWEHLIRDDVDFARHVDYIHFNPVKHGLAQRPVDWCCRQYIRQGLVTPDWAVGLDEGRNDGTPNSAALHPGYDFS